MTSLAPILITNASQLWGVLLLGHPISESFFLFWFEFILVSLVTIAQVALYFHHWPLLPRQIKTNWTVQITSLILVIGLLLTVFFLLVYRGEGGERDDLPGYVAAMTISMLVLTLTYVYSFWRGYVREKKYLAAGLNAHTRGLVEKGSIFAVIYLIYIMQYHWSGSTELTLSRGYLVFMVSALVFAKAAVEIVLKVKTDKKQV